MVFHIEFRTHGGIIHIYIYIYTHLFHYTCICCGTFLLFLLFASYVFECFPRASLQKVPTSSPSWPLRPAPLPRITAPKKGPLAIQPKKGHDRGIGRAIYLAYRALFNFPLLVINCQCIYVTFNVRY